MTEREVFEAWARLEAKRRGHETDYWVAEQNALGEYSTIWVEGAWQAWKHLAARLVELAIEPVRQTNIALGAAQDLLIEIRGSVGSFYSDRYVEVLDLINSALDRPKEDTPYNLGWMAGFDAYKRANPDLPTLDQIMQLLPKGNAYLDEPDGGNVTLAEQLKRMSIDAARYRFIRDVPYAPNILRVMGHQLNKIMDSEIDVSMNKSKKDAA